MAEAKTKIKKKQWVQIIAPKLFDNALLGETHVNEKEQVLAKNISANLMTLTDDPRKQAYNVRFDIAELKDGKAHTQVVGIGMTPSAVRRLIRRGRDKIDDSFVMKIAGGRMVRIKPVLITGTKASKAAQTEMRLTTRKRMRDLYGKMRFDDLVKDVIESKTQRLIKDLCAKTHPLRSADIREAFILPNDRKMTQEMKEQIEREFAEEEARRAQIASAAAAASVGEETAPAPRSRKPKRKEPAPQEIEEAGKSRETPGPEDPGV